MGRPIVMPRDALAHLRYQLHRHGWPAVAGLVLAVCAMALQLLGVQPLRARTGELTAAQAIARPAALQAPSPEAIQDRQLAGFYARLPAATGALETVAAIHAAASANGVTLAHGEYRLARDGKAPVWRYQISLPARASYPHLRAWLDDTLNAVPAASLDEISLRREDSTGDSVEARVRLTLYMRAD